MLMHEYLCVQKLAKEIKTKLYVKNGQWLKAIGSTSVGKRLIGVSIELIFLASNTNFFEM